MSSDLMIRSLAAAVVVISGCSGQQSDSGPEVSSVVSTALSAGSSLVDARAGFETSLTSTGSPAGPADIPSQTDPFDLIHYDSPVGELVAYITKDPGDGQKHPAIVWITGGDNNSIGDVWSPNDRNNDQSAAAFREAGIVMMFPSQRGGNDNPGRREGFLGEVDDILAATDYLAARPFVDSDRIYLGGHSTGGTVVMLVGEYSDRYSAIFSLGPVAGPEQYGGAYVYADINDSAEMRVRSPLYWLDDVRRPMYVFEGAVDGNWDGAIDLMAQENMNQLISFYRVPGHDHFSVIAPLCELLAAQIVAGEIKLDESMLANLK